MEVKKFSLEVNKSRSLMARRRASLSEVDVARTGEHRYHCGTCVHLWLMQRVLLRIPLGGELFVEF